MGNRTSEHWGKEAGTWQIGRGIHWTEHPAVQDRINEKVSGDPQRDAYQFFIDFLSAQDHRLPLKRCLTLGCGAGDLERGLSQYRFTERHDAYDIADEAVRRAREQANDRGLTHIFYEVVDTNHLSLPSDTYDVIFGIQSVHHFQNLEHIFLEVRKALKPNGFFFLNEFIGPSKFQWTDTQLNIVNALLSILPKRYCISKKDGLTRKSSYRRPSIAEMDSIDPSEAVRSAEILKVLSQFFAVRIQKDIGGTILHLLLQDIAGNFDYESPDDMLLLRTLFQIEDTFIKLGEISSDFAVIIAQKD